ncbi:MAG: sensor domain-containing diguanylate cyclase [Pseudomonadota bacterium]
MPTQKSTATSSVTAPFADMLSAARQIVRTSGDLLPMDCWMVTKVDGDDWIMLAVQTTGYDVKEGDIFTWSDSICSRMAKGLGPMFAPDISVLHAYRSAPIANQLKIGAYIGLPLLHADGSLFGTLCAVHPTPIVFDITLHREWLILQSRLLSSLVAAEQREEATSQALTQERHAAQLDELTGVYNRRGWNRLIEIEEERCVRYDKSAAVLIVDLDDLKNTNDAFGHERGDVLLRRAANALHHAVRSFDVVCRIGGDEFAILAIEADEQSTTELVNRVRRLLDEEGIPASIGWACRDSEQSLPETVKVADRRMYDDKRARKRVH